MSAFRAAAFTFALALSPLAGCVLGTEQYAGKACDTSADCPGGLECVPASAAGGGVCASPGSAPEGEFGDGGAGTGGDGTGSGGEGTGTGSGGGTGADGGTATGPFYCKEVKPILDTYCASCHKVPPTGGAPSSFRLDVYAALDGVLGAKEKAPRIKARASDTRTMPPASAPQPSDAERAVLAAWVQAGAPECEDSPTDPNAPPPVDNSVGYTGGPVSFAQHVQPLFDAYCASCHATLNPEGDLDLRPGQSHAALMAWSDEESDWRRVVPGDPSRSLLMVALTGSDPELIDPMPLNTPGLKTIAPADLAVIEAWIIQGAKNN